MKLVPCEINCNAYSLAYVTSVAYNYWKTDTCKFESSQKDGISGFKQAEYAQTGHEAAACFIIIVFWAKSRE